MMAQIAGLLGGTGGMGGGMGGTGGGMERARFLPGGASGDLDAWLARWKPSATDKIFRNKGWNEVESGFKLI